MAHLAIALVLGIMAVYFGRNIMRTELEDATYENINKIIKLWVVLASMVIFIVMTICFMHRSSFKPYDVFILMFTSLFSLFIGIVDCCTHNMYLETSPFFLLFPIGGWLTVGFNNMALGALSGFCLAAIIVCIEFLFRRKISLGGADVLFIIFGNALVGFSHTELYWFCAAVCSSLTAIIVLIYGKASKKKIGRFTNIPILGMLGFATIVVFTASLLEARTGSPAISGLCLRFCAPN